VPSGHHRTTLQAQCCNSLRTVGGVMPSKGSGPLYLVAEAYLDKPYAASFTRMPQCPGVHTNQTLLSKESSEYEAFLANVHIRCMLSPVLLSSVCNGRVPYSAG